MRVLVIGGNASFYRQAARRGSCYPEGRPRRHGHAPQAEARTAGARTNLVARPQRSATRCVGVARRRFELFFDNVYDWERGTTGAQVEATAQACGDGGERATSSCPASPPLATGWTTTTTMPGLAGRSRPLRPQQGDQRADAVPDAPAHGFPVVTIRPPFVYGPRNPFYREAFFWDRMRDGRPIIVPDDGNRLMQFVFVGDIVRVCLRALEVVRWSGGRSMLVCALRSLSWNLSGRSAARAGIEPEIRFIPRDEAVAAGGKIMGSKLYFAEYYDLPPITMKLDRMVNTLGVPPTPLEEGLRFTYDWWVANSTFPRPDYSFEDALSAPGDTEPR